MTQHREESLIDKIKGALGMGRSEDAHTEGMHEHTSGAGVVERTDYGEEPGGSANRPAGPDFAAQEGVDTDLGVAGTGTADAGLGHDPGRESVSDSGAVSEPGWTRGEAASGESPFEPEPDDLETDRPEREI